MGKCPRAFHLIINSSWLFFVCLSFFKIKKTSSYNVSAALHIMRILVVLILTDVTLALITSEIHFQADQRRILNGCLHTALC